MKPQNLTERAMRLLREEIITGKLPAAAKLNEVDLAKRLGISRPPIHEALLRLNKLKLVISFPRKGSFVTEMSIEDCKHLHHARLMLESTAIEILRKSTGISLETICSTLKVAEARDAEDRDDNFPQMVSIHKFMSDFHLRIVECSNNKWLIDAYRVLRWSLARYQIMYLKTPGALDRSQEDHYSILERLESGEFIKAKTELIDHLKSIQKQLIIRMRDTLPPQE